MIVFDLKCSTGHVFEAWFGSTGDWEDQQRRKLVSCPMCGSDEVAKAVMAPAVPAKGNSRAENQPKVPMSGGDDPAQVKAMMAALAKAQGEFLKTADYVGDRFADEARAMHLGERDHRQIYGETTPGEAKALLDEGVPVAPLPLPVRPRRSDA
jgi:hypothetical protein